MVKFEKAQNLSTRKLFIRKCRLDYNSNPNSEVKNEHFGIQPLSDRRRMYDLVLVYRILHGFCGPSRRDFFMIRLSRTPA